MEGVGADRTGRGWVGGGGWGCQLTGAQTASSLCVFTTVIDDYEAVRFVMPADTLLETEPINIYPYCWVHGFPF